jgi:HK97 family phage portal protein
MSHIFDLTARQHESRVLGAFLATRPPGALERAGMRAPMPQADATRSVEWGGISWDDWVRGNVGSIAGVSEKSARAVAAVTACVNLIGGAIAALPLHTYRRVGEDREAYKTDLWWLLNERPYEGWTAAAMWEYLASARLFHGDAFARIHRVSKFNPAPAGFEPLHPDRVRVRKEPSGLLVYDVAPEKVGQVAVTVEGPDMLHVPGPGFDGMRSLSQLQFALRNAAGIALAADGQAATFISDGVRPDFAIEIPGTLKPEQAETFRKTFRDRNSGQSSSRVPVVLQGGMKLHQLTLSSEDAQLMETRGFQIEEICRVFGVPPFMIGHTDKTTSWGTGIEQMSIGFVKFTLGRHLAAIEQELNFKLFKTSRNFCEFVTAGLERGDLKGRYESYRIALGRAGEPGWMTASEIRRMENLPADEQIDNPPPPANPAPQP